MNELSHILSRVIRGCNYQFYIYELSQTFRMMVYKDNFRRAGGLRVVRI